MTCVRSRALRSISYAAFSMAILCFTGCNSIVKDLIKSPEVRLDKVRIENVKFMSADLIFDLEVFNPNSINLKIDSIDYQLTLDDKEFANGHVHKIKELPAGQKTQIEIPVNVEFLKVFDSLSAALKKPETLYKITGKAKLGPLSVPFNDSGTLKWKEQQ